MLHFEGDKDFSIPPAEAWAKLSDVRFLVQCVPGVESVPRLEPDSAVFVLRPGFSFARGTLEMTVGVIERVEGASLRLLVSSKGIGSTSAVEVTLTIAAGAETARVHWTADIKELGGLLKAVPHGLIKASAQKVIADVWAAVEARVKT